MENQRIAPFISVLETLQSTKGTKDKEAILNENILCPHLKEYLVYAIDDRIKFNITKITKVVEQVPVGRMGQSTWDVFEGIVKELSSGTLRGDKAVGTIQSFLSRCTQLEKKWYTKCIQKDLACISGLGRNLMDSVWPSSVLYFKCGLAEEEAQIEKAVWPSGLELKKNGIRSFFFVGEDNELFVPQYEGVRLPVGRSGIPISNFNVLTKFVKQLKVEGFVLDGEISVEDRLEDVQSVFNFDFSKTPDDFRLKSGKVGSGWDKYKKRMNEVLEFQKKMKFTIFDIVPTGEWDKKQGTETYLQRRERLAPIKARIAQLGIGNSVEVIDSIIVNTYEEAMEIINRWIAAGFEGGIIKSLESLYEWRRWIHWIKCKEEVEFDFRVLGVYLGKQKYNGDGTPKESMAGGISVEDRDGRMFEIGTGIGWNEAFYIELLENKEDYIGRIGTGVAQKLTAKSAINPRFGHWRTDRTHLEE
jgi:hypothetical protein